ncbi:MtrAB system histidine kinase MtrB [Stackebrandtia nassauensis]|uniref:Sensor histidine kinase MtrB n=1 Tax=Stackebrandtia nassauensis (strain DSM 44728 / CIP 108903 / NRRL B-16338 / NBRC 102104 / LLR-40K-21) TaxID=446470 RepID=D3PYH9_STANL|nr:MtrAB system histidine kinase MtrB [Stackebrandtia nassauensis]ADD41546.1 histidine kinase [Stackebrandtia nassauensis DSM 44728]
MKAWNGDVGGWTRAAVRRARRLIRFLLARGRRFAAPVVRAYRSSLQLRVVTATLIVSALLVAVFGIVVATTITGGMVEKRLNAAEQQVTQAGEQIAQDLATVPSADDPALENKLAGLAAEHSGDGDGTQQATVLLRTVNANTMESRPKEPEFVEPMIPTDLEHDVSEGYLAFQYANINPDGKEERPFLVMGTPVYTDKVAYQLYFLFPLDTEEEAAALVRNALIVSGIALVLMLGVIAGLVTRMVVIPVRLAARTAQRLSAGLLHERMTVRGSDDLARLAGSFNLMAENLHQQIVRLEDMSRLQRRFTSDVSHELRTPLTTVRMAADLLYDSKHDFPPTAARSTELLHDELNRFEELLGDLLEISRFDAGFAKLDTEAVELGPIIESVIKSFDQLARRCGVEVRRHFPDTPVIAEVDARRVQRIVRNLVGNAIEHAESKPVCVRLDASATAVAIVVRDRGIGLKPGEEKLVFNRFWRADPSRARQTGGTGLGLSISTEDAKLHNGTLTAVGERGRGAVFRLSLPLRAGDRVLVPPLPLDFSADPCDGADDEPAS